MVIKFTGCQIFGNPFFIADLKMIVMISQMQTAG